MKHQMDKEKWIDEVLGSAGKLQRQEASPFLFEQVTAKIVTAKNQKAIVARPGMKWALGAVAVVLIVINVLSVAKAGNAKHSGPGERMEIVNELNNSVIYNY